MNNLEQKPEPGAGQPMPPAHESNTSLTRREFRQSTEPPIYDTKKTFAALIGVSVRSIEKMLAEQRLPAIRMSRKIVRIPRQEALDHLRRNYTVNAR